MSPKFHEYRDRVTLGVGRPGALLNWHVVYVGQLAVNATLGGWLPAGSLSVTLRVVEANLPQPSVVVSVIV